MASIVKLCKAIENNEIQARFCFFFEFKKSNWIYFYFLFAPNFRFAEM